MGNGSSITTPCGGPCKTLFEIQLNLSWFLAYLRTPRLLGTQLVETFLWLEVFSLLPQLIVYWQYRPQLLVVLTLYGLKVSSAHISQKQVMPFFLGKVSESTRC